MGTGTTETAEVDGYVEPGFEAVRAAFAAAGGRPGGAAFAAWLDGRPVVDLWVGQAEPGRPWERDTPAVTMSAIKGVTALAAHILIDRGVLAEDEPVSTYWPEYAAAGKHDTLVRHFLSHTAGVVTVPGYQDFMRPAGKGWDQQPEIARRLAAATPLWTPGTKAAYHAFTFGWLVDELIQRVTGKSMRQVLQDEINTPLGVEIHLGADDGDPVAARRAMVITPPRPTEDQPEAWEFYKTFISAETPLGQSVFADGTTNAIYELDHFMNSGPGINLPLSGTNGISTARDLAKVFQILACGGEVDGVRLLSENAVTKARSLQFDGIDELWRVPARWAAGFQRTGNMGTRFGTDDAGFGQPGQGGQYAWADPSRRLSFAYVRSYLDLVVDLAPMDALYAAIA